MTKRWLLFTTIRANSPNLGACYGPPFGVHRSNCKKVELNVCTQQASIWYIINRAEDGCKLCLIGRCWIYIGIDVSSDGTKANIEGGPSRAKRGNFLSLNHAKKKNMTEHTKIDWQDITFNFSLVILQHVNGVNQAFELSYSGNVG